MKKFLGIFVAVMLCVCMVAPAASAAIDVESLLSKLEGVDVNNLNAGEIAEILGVDTADLGSVLEGLKNSGSGSDTVDYVLKNLVADNSAAPAADAAGTVTTAATTEGTTASSGGGIADKLSGIGDMLGGIDLSSIASSDVLSKVTDLFGNVDLSSFDVGALKDTIGGAFSGAGIDLSSITGKFDIGSIGGGSSSGGDSSSSGGDSSSSGGDSSSSGGGVMDKVSSIMDKLKGGLGSLGLDMSALDGLKDNEVVNFFANLYQGLGKVDDKKEDKPAVVTTAAPKTGDTSSVIVAIATLSVASAAAFVCLNAKKKNED